MGPCAPHAVLLFTYESPRRLGSHVEDCRQSELQLMELTVLSLLLNSSVVSRRLALALDVSRTIFETCSA